jgi:hypothetical protein
MSQNQYEYDVALSFAGADREVARVIASIAEVNGLRVFLDEHHLWESWGKNLNEYLGEIYDRKSQFCVILISKDYCDKAYTNLERRRALDRALESKVEYILPVRLDDSWLDGLPRATAYLDQREMSSIEIAASLVRKIKGGDAQVRTPEGIDAPKVVPLDRVTTKRFSPGWSNDNQPIEFAEIRVAEESKSWRLFDSPKENSGLVFRGGVGWYEDPIFDITILSAIEKPVLLTAVGIEVVKLSCSKMLILGGGGAQPVNLHRTYKLELPDLWRVLAEKQRELGAGRYESVDVDEYAYTRLPDPILFQGHRGYRFGLHLFDFVNYCPTDMELLFWVRTNQGDARSEPARLTYEIGSQISPLSRYQRLFYGEDEVKKQEQHKLELLRPDDKEQKLQTLAYELWEHAGRPQGRAQEFWNLAEAELPSRLLCEGDLSGFHKRPMEIATGTR